MCIVRHKTTNVLYRYLENDRYRNLSTGVEGEVRPETAQKIFAINLDATEMFNEYPNIENLIRSIGLNIQIDQ